MIKVDEVSGCLKVTRLCEEIGEEPVYALADEAKAEWERFDNWRDWTNDKDFGTFYHLNKEEIAIYNAKDNMPESFIKKYVKYVRYICFSHDEKFFYHLKGPNTCWELDRAIRKKQAFEVQCSICGRKLFTDEASFKCRKHRSCKGAECLSTTLQDDQEADYNNNLFDNWNSNEHELQITNSQLANLDQISSPLSYYGTGDSIKIAYISDIHLGHHSKYYSSTNAMIRSIADALHYSYSQEDAILFNGDTATNVELNIKFYRYFMSRYNYKYFRQYKERLNKIKEMYHEANAICETELIRKLKKLSSYVEIRKSELKKYFDYAVFEKYRDYYRPDCTYVAAFEYFKQVNSYKKCSVSDEVEKKIIELSFLMDRLERYENYLNNERERKNLILKTVSSFEDEYSKSIDDITILDYKHQRMKNVFVTLGNHEYVEFANVKSGILYYSKILSDLGITLLANNFIETDRFIIYGGTGFAGYDENWNANNTICCPNFSREDEIKETKTFVEGYNLAYQYAKEKGLCFISASHYPVSACLGHYDCETIYFTGHNHNKEYYKSNDKVLYADNQIGYMDNNFTFRIATTGIEINPYFYLADGLYKTSIKDYLQFYRYLGEDVGKCNLLYQRCQNGKANLYVVKRRGYYGFFLITFNGNSKGISIINGGATKKITDSTDINWICDNFEIVLSKYLQVLMPLRLAQEHLAEELSILGLSGRIHGCIVDIDYYHHIMLNPADGSMVFYFSAYFGCVEELASFEEVIASIRKNKNLYFFFDNEGIKSVEKKYKELAQTNKLFLTTKSNTYMIETQNKSVSDTRENTTQIVSRKEGMYGVSRKVNPLQRLFSGHVLRDFDLILTETEQKAYRTKLYTNERFFYEGIEYIITQDEGKEIIVATEVKNDKKSKSTNEIVLTNNTRRFAITSLRKKLSKGERNSFWIREKQ